MKSWSSGRACPAVRNWERLRSMPKREWEQVSNGVIKAVSVALVTCLRHTAMNTPETRSGCPTNKCPAFHMDSGGWVSKHEVMARVQSLLVRVAKGIRIT